MPTRKDAGIAEGETRLAHFKTLTSQVVALPIDDVNTDQIIPARFLTGTVKHGLGEHLFADWRFLPDGSPHPDFILNKPEAQGARILLTGGSFGCGSSREHAVWSLVGWGFRAVIAPSFADIFRANALQNGLLTVQLESPAFHELLGAIRKDPGARVTIDLLGQTLTLPDGRTETFPMDAFSKRCLLADIDQMDYLLSLEERISAYEVAHAYA